jgi:hypothetical protein
MCLQDEFLGRCRKEKSMMHECIIPATSKPPYNKIMSPKKLVGFLNDVHKFTFGPSKRNSPSVKHTVPRRLQPPYNNNNGRRKKGTPYTYQEKRHVLLAVNTIGVSHWKTILETYPSVFRNRDNVGVKDIDAHLVKKGYALARYAPSSTHDCFTEAALKDFNLNKGQKDDILDDGTVYSIRSEMTKFEGDEESRLILLGVNTVYGKTHKPWECILNAHRNEFGRNERTAVNLKDRYRTMVDLGLAVDLKHRVENQDCFTAAARNKYSLVRGEQDPSLAGVVSGGFS